MAPSLFVNETNDQSARHHQSQAYAGPFNGTLGGYWSVERRYTSDVRGFQQLDPSDKCSDIRNYRGDPLDHTQRGQLGAVTSRRPESQLSVSSYGGYGTYSPQADHFVTGSGNVSNTPHYSAIYGNAFAAANGDSQLFTHLGYATLAPIRIDPEHRGSPQVNKDNFAFASPGGASKHAIARAGSNSRREPLPRYACDIFGCTDTFSRAFDVKRHKGTAHDQGSRIYVCNADGCDFEDFRRDKACQHVREKSHGSVSVVDVDDELHEGEAESDSEAGDESGAE